MRRIPAGVAGAALIVLYAGMAACTNSVTHSGPDLRETGVPTRSSAQHIADAATDPVMSELFFATASTARRHQALEQHR